MILNALIASLFFVAAEQHQVDRALLHHAVKILSGSEVDPSIGLIKDRYGSEGKGRARHFLTRSYREMGYRPRTHRFESYGTKGMNSSFESPRPFGAPFFLLSAHLDTRSVGGANDNSSGLAVQLAVAEAFSRLELEMPIVVMAWDLEELGLLGSEAHAYKMKREGAVGAINMDMVGKNEGAPEHLLLSHCSRGSSKTLFELMLGTMGRLTGNLGPDEKCFGRSDHENLWGAGIPTLHIQGGYPHTDSCYHQACDTIENIDFDYLDKVANLVLNFLVDYTNTKWESKD